MQGRERKEREGVREIKYRQIPSPRGEIEN